MHSLFVSKHGDSLYHFPLRFSKMTTFDQVSVHVTKEGYATVYGPQSSDLENLEFARRTLFDGMTKAEGRVYTKDPNRTERELRLLKDQIEQSSKALNKLRELTGMVKRQQNVERGILPKSFAPQPLKIVSTSA